MKTNGSAADNSTRTSALDADTPAATAQHYDLLTPDELAQRWKVPVSWVRTNIQSRCEDPIPCIRLGRYVKFQWDSPHLLSWWRRRGGQV